MAIQQLPRRAEPTSLRKKADSPDDFDAVLDSMAADSQIASEADAHKKAAGNTIDADKKAADSRTDADKKTADGKPERCCCT